MWKQKTLEVWIWKQDAFWARLWWMTPVILATQEAEIRRILVQSQPRQIAHEILFQKTLHKHRAGRVAQGEGPEIKLQYHKKKKMCFGSFFHTHHLSPLVISFLQLGHGGLWSPAPQRPVLGSCTDEQAS
jgi:hypothetical protein